MTNRHTFFGLALVLASYSFSFAQDEKSLIDWQRKDLTSDGVAGVSSLKAIELLKDRKPKKVVVAIIDSGVDIDHEDLKDNIWVNADEIPGNGIDDDKNGYVDDVHGWNFLGNAAGTNLDEANLELTRIFRKLAPKFQGVESAKAVAAEDKADYALYVKVRDEINKELKESAQEFAQIGAFVTIFNMADSAIKASIKKDSYSLDDVMSWKPEGEQQTMFQQVLSGVMTDPNFSKAELDKYYDYLNDKVNFHYNPKYVDRSHLGDDPDDFANRFYGNNDVSAPHNDHGTHVAGIVGAVVGNGIGMDGICPQVELMILRAVPNGDEFDKDIANAIRYAADNGAEIMNMSFGKGYSPHADEVHKAIRYAEEKGVLMIHAAGNDSENIDKAPNFPSPFYEFQSTPCQTWLTIGASSSNADNSLPGVFSNYGIKNVDLFAPGVQVYSAKPGNTYEYEDGTSMAAPVTSGVAALIKSYFPSITAVQLKELLVSTCAKYSNLKVLLPDPEYNPKKATKFKKLSRTGGVVNAYNAAQRALELYP